MSDSEEGLMSSIFTMSRNELLEYICGEGPMITTFIQNLSADRVLLDVYNNIADEPLTAGRRAKIKHWFNQNGAQFYALNVLTEYCWVKFLGKGAFSTAHLIKHNDQTRVIKITHIKHTGDSDIEAFRREANILEKLDCPHVINLYQFDLTKNYFWLLTEYCNLGSLDDVLSNESKIVNERRISFLTQLIDALVYIHSQNVIHRDIKPANIFASGISYSDAEIQYKLGDFNLSRFTDNTTNPCNMSYCGTPNYMAPELLNKEPYDARVDVWSLMCVFLRIACGEHVYPAFLSLESLLHKFMCDSEIEKQFIIMAHHIKPLERSTSDDIKRAISKLQLKRKRMLCYDRYFYMCSKRCGKIGNKKTQCYIDD